MFKTELPKIKEGFFKVKNDMLFLSDKITHNYSEFIAHHNNLSKDIHKVTVSLQDQINHIKKNIINNTEFQTIKKNTINFKNQDLDTKQFASKADILRIQSEIKELKQIVKDSHGEHIKISSLLEKIKENSSLIKDNKKENRDEIKKLKEQTKSTELELYLLKEKLSQKDEEIKDLKDISRKMFDIIDDLSRIELDLVNHQIKT